MTGTCLDPSSIGQFAHWRCVSLKRNYCTAAVDRIKASSFIHLTSSHCSCFLSMSCKTLPTSWLQSRFDCWIDHKPENVTTISGLGGLTGIKRPGIHLPEVCLFFQFEGIIWRAAGFIWTTSLNIHQPSFLALRERRLCLFCHCGKWRCLADMGHESEMLIWGVNTGTALCGWGNRTQTKRAFDQRAAALFVPEGKAWIQTLKTLASS